MGKKKKKMLVVITFQNRTIKFSFMEENEKELYIQMLIENRMNQAFYLASAYGNNSNIIHDHVILMAGIKHSNMAKILTKKLSGEMKFCNFSRKFVEAMDEVFR